MPSGDEKPEQKPIDGWATFRERMDATLAGLREKNAETAKNHLRLVQPLDADTAAALTLADLTAAGVPKREREVVAGKHDDTTPVRAAVKFLHAPTLNFLVLWGGPGSGKGVAAAAAVARSPGALWVPAPTLRHLDAGGYATAKELDRLLHRIGRARLVVLDELGTEPKHLADGTWGEMVDRVVNLVYAARHKMIITTNLDKPSFGGDADAKPRYGMRVADRLRECGYFHSCGDVSLRKTWEPAVAR